MVQSKHTENVNEISTNGLLLYLKKWVPQEVNFVDKVEREKNMFPITLCFCSLQNYPEYILMTKISNMRCYVTKIDEYEAREQINKVLKIWLKYRNRIVKVKNVAYTFMKINHVSLINNIARKDQGNPKINN